MNKSHLSRTNNPTAVVTMQDVGSFVSVSGVGKGILHYVGEVHGKNGLYCGIELDTPTGKHNGTYQGVVYFVCRPRHGIFAPLYRVELDEIDDVPMMTASQTTKVHERLSRSALPALQLRNVFRPSEDLTTMQTSFGTEKIMETSTYSNLSWGDSSDAMVCSNATFVIPPGRSHFEDSEECDLMSIPAPKSILNINREQFKHSEESILGTSVVLDESRVGVENLPVVEDVDDDDDDDNDDDVDDDDDLQTPLVEAPQWQPSLGSFSQPPSIIETTASPITESRVLSDHTPKELPLRTNSRQSIDTGYNDESDASRLEHEELSISADNKESGNLEREVRSSRSRRMEKEPPPPPKFPVKPKPPSKHQLLMEQIKASIEADKMKPKKEIKARISLMLQQTRAPPTQNENTIDDKMPDTPRRVLKQPLKTVNAMPPTPPKTERPKRERKPLYVPPPPKERKEVKTSTPLVRNGVEKPIDSPNVSKITAEETPPKRPNAAKSKPSSLINEVKLRNKAHIGSKVNGMVRAEISNVEKLQRLQCVSRAFEALCVMITRSEIESARLRSELLQANENIAHQQEIVGELKAHLSEREKLHLEDIERYRSHNEQVARSQAEALERTKERYEQQLSEKVKEAETALEDERTRHEAELEAMSRRHQKVVTSLDEKIAEGEKTIEQLMVDKKTLQKALANDSDQRNQMLTKEINSLQTALEFKSCEMKELRQKYQQVALRVEEIPVKELEITKLKHKVTELKQALDQKLTYEKMLLHQNEELKRQHMAIEEERESMQRNFDVMIYRYGNGEEVEQSPKQKSGKVQFRSRSSTSDRPQSNARLSQTSICDMDRSSDRDSLVRSTISMYASQVQLPENHDDDVIYAPDEIITSNVARGGFSTLSKRIDNSSTCYPENITRSVNGNHHSQTDSGIGV